MNVALLGFGVVGRGVYDLTLSRSDVTVKYVLCLEDVTLPGVTVTRDYQQILNDETLDTVVEAMGGLHPAWDFVKAAIEHGKNVVTSNKAMVATFYDELLPLVQEKGVLFRCTAAVGGGIGWLSELGRVRRCETITAVGGIMNGTCNYILDNMTSLGLDYDVALKQAQALGYAEANPSTDVDGIDTWHKIILSSNVAFGVSLDKATVPVAGIRSIQACDVAAFREHGYTCKLLSTGKREDGVIHAYVQPTLCPDGDLEAHIPMNFNLITFEGAAAGRQSLFGQGAGRYPTAYNVVQDLMDLKAGNGFYAPCDGTVAACNDEKLPYYVRGERDSWLESHQRDTWGQGIVTEPVSVSEMHAWCAEHPNAFMAAIRERKEF